MQKYTKIRWYTKLWYTKCRKPRVFVVQKSPKIYRLIIVLSRYFYKGLFGLCIGEIMIALPRRHNLKNDGFFKISKIPKNSIFQKSTSLIENAIIVVILKTHDYEYFMRTPKHPCTVGNDCKIRNKHILQIQRPPSPKS